VHVLLAEGHRDVQPIPAYEPVPTLCPCLSLCVLGYRLPDELRQQQTVTQPQPTLPTPTRLTCSYSANSHAKVAASEIKQARRSAGSYSYGLVSRPRHLTYTPLEHKIAEKYVGMRTPTQVQR
jgi:hypothetical protein